MQIFVRSDETLVFNLPTDATVGELQDAIEDVVGMEQDDQMLTYGGSVLSDPAAVLSAAYAITDDATLDLTSRLRGGKVHGSLARAGKVRGQTPKVDKQEKRKKKTGRAKRRIQFKRRFTMEVARPGGRRRGPNANTK